MPRRHILTRTNDSSAPSSLHASAGFFAGGHERCEPGGLSLAIRPAARIAALSGSSGVRPSRVGAGAGYHIAQFTEDYSFFSRTSTAKGLGLKILGEGNTEFDEHLFADIALEIRDDILGEFKDHSGEPLVNKSTDKHVKMNFFSLGDKFGLSYFF